MVRFETNTDSHMKISPILQIAVAQKTSSFTSIASFMATNSLGGSSLPIKWKLIFSHFAKGTLPLRGRALRQTRMVRVAAFKLLADTHVSGGAEADMSRDVYEFLESPSFTARSPRVQRNLVENRDCWAASSLATVRARMPLR